MKAFLLAAGMGTRLKPITDKTPKCLLPIHDKPLLEIWIDLFEKHGISDVLVNTHHHSEQVEAFIDKKQNTTSVKIKTAFENRLLGSGGTVLANKNFVEDDNNFLIAYADNLTDINLTQMINFHSQAKQKGCCLSMGLFHAPIPEACGIASLDANNRIIGFIEKPQYPESDLANAGIYIASNQIYNFFPDDKNQNEEVIDFGLHVLPRLVGNMFGYEITAYLRDIGTIESYKAALEEWPVIP